MTGQLAADLPARWRGLVADTGLLLFVAALGVKATYGVAPYRDLDGADEAAYALGATNIARHGLPPVEHSPVYVLWDALLLRSGIPVQEVPFTSWAVLASLLPAAVYVLIRAMGGCRLVALAAGGFLPATTLIDIYPHPMHLATVVLALGTALAARFRRAAPAGAILGLTLLLATYTRPEFLYSLYLFTPVAGVGGAWLLWRRPGSRKSLLISAGVLAAGASLMVWLFGSPKGDGHRSVVAFGQHYALNLYLAGQRIENPWYRWEDYLRDDFGKVAPVAELYQANPGAMLRHVARNARQLPSHLKHAITPCVDLLWINQLRVLPGAFPAGHARTLWIARSAMVTGFVIGLAGLGFGVRRWLRDGTEPTPLPVGGIMLALVAAPALAAALLIYPRFHYLMPTVVFAVALAAAGYRHLPLRERLGSRTLGWLAVLGTAAVLAAVVPNRAVGLCLQSRLGDGAILPQPRPLRASVATLRELGVASDVVCFDHCIARVVYAGFERPPLRAEHVGPAETFLSFAERTQVGVVLVDRTTADIPQFRRDPHFQALVGGHETPEFRLVPVKEYPHIRFAVRRDLPHPGRDVAGTPRQ